MDFDYIKLIIWDLDETLWEGVLSDGTAKAVPSHLKLVRDAADAGVVNSICSKNDREEVREFMTELGVWDLFVFNSINWSSKGERVRQIITEMNLREANVLFIDDNHLNLQEVKEYCPGITAEAPDVIPQLAEYFANAPKKDAGHARLEQYKLLEKKKEFRARAGSNEEFLYSCNIRVSVGYDCAENIERIADLVQRSNQLNFTKVRSSEEELRELFADPEVRCGYVSADDKFGEYGIVGFFALRGESLLHFVFSCRTLNMGVEQYVYDVLDRPAITVIGEVASSLDGDAPRWINQKNSAASSVSKEEFGNTKTVIKGLCDMEQIFSFVKWNKNVIKEFVYVNRHGVSIEGGIHTMHVVQSLTLPEETKKRLAGDLPFGDGGMYDTAMFQENIGAVYLSLFADPNLGLYREKSSGAVVAFGEYTNDLTDESIWDDLIAHRLFDANCDFTRESLRYIKDNFEFLGRITPEETVKNLEFIRSHIDPGAKLILNLGSEVPYDGDTAAAYADRHLYHKKQNELVRQWKDGKDNVYLIELTKYIKSSDDYTNNINHFTKAVYFALVQEFMSIIKDDSMKIRKRRKPRYMRKLGNIITKVRRRLRGGKR